MFQKIISTLNSPSFIYANDTKHEINVNNSIVQKNRVKAFLARSKTKSNPKLKTFHSNGKTVFADGPQVPGLAKGNGQLSRNVL